MMEATTLTVVFLGQAGIGIGATLGVYKALEWNWVLGWFVGLALVTSVVIAEWLLGAALLTVTYRELQLLVIVSVLGGLAGTFSTVVLTKPDVEPDSRPVPEDASQIEQVES